MQDLEGKVAVVTGAGSGIGEGIARAAHGAGMRVVVADIDREKADLVAAQLGEGAIAASVDVADLSSVEALRDTAVEHFWYRASVVQQRRRLDRCADARGRH